MILLVDTWWVITNTNLLFRFLCFLKFKIEKNKYNLICILFPKIKYIDDFHYVITS